MGILDSDREIHKIEECPQAPVLAQHGAEMKRHGDILDRLERHSEKQTEALQIIAEQGAVVKHHGQQLDKHDQQFDVIFGKYRVLDDRTRVLELKDAEGVGEIKAEAKFDKKQKEEDKKLWTILEKIQLCTPILAVLFFGFFILDKFGVFELIAKLFREMLGK